MTDTSTPPAPWALAWMRDQASSLPPPQRLGYEAIILLPSSEEISLKLSSPSRYGMPSGPGPLGSSERVIARAIIKAGTHPLSVLHWTWRGIDLHTGLPIPSAPY